MSQENDILEVIANCYREHIDQISQFTQTGYSFEEWLNWEACWACLSRGWKTLPKPGYRACQFKDSDYQADLLVELTPARKAIIECALIHDWTSSKWIDKLEADRKKLEPPYAEGFFPIQMICVASKDQFLKLDNWMRWLNKISFWNMPSIFHQEMPLPPTGMLMIRAWR